MIRIIKSLSMGLLLTCVSINSLASFSLDDANANPPDKLPYYENEGNMAFKVRLSGILSKGKQSGLPTPTVADPVKVGGLIENGYGGDVSTTIFFNHYLGAELSLGFNALCTKHAALENVNHNYGIDPGERKKRKYIFMIPATVTGVFHIAPYGSIRPYIGVGYHGSYLLTRVKDIKIKNGHGAVIQGGIDFYAKDDTFVNLDVRQFFLNPKVTYKQLQNVISKVKLNPLVISVGIGFNF